jgi:hypothetical protein
MEGRWKQGDLSIEWPAAAETRQKTSLTVPTRRQQGDGRAARQK